MGAVCSPMWPCSLQYMEKLSQLAYHPLKMQSCYEKMDPLRLDGLQQRFDVSSTSVFKQRAQIHMREVCPLSPHPASSVLGPQHQERETSLSMLLGMPVSLAHLAAHQVSLRPAPFPPGRRPCHLVSPGISTLRQTPASRYPDSIQATACPIPLGQA